MRTRAALVAAALVAVGVAGVPAHAAPKKKAPALVPVTKTLLFANEGVAANAQCVVAYTLNLTGGGDPCSNIQVGAEGNGLFAEDTFSATKQATGYKLDASKPLTGTVYIATYPILSGTPVVTLPGTAAADITILINGKEITKFEGKGNALTPNSSVAIPVNAALPKSLDKVVVKSVDVVVSYTTAAGVVGVDYSAENPSKLLVPAFK